MAAPEGKKIKIVILGPGRIGQAVRHYLGLYLSGSGVLFSFDEGRIRDCDLIVGALPGETGHRCLESALRHKKDLVDISDMDPPFYLKYKRDIRRQGITVVPECGFSPGLVNFLLGHEISLAPSIDEIRVKAGSLSPKERFFPFLWCFQDLVLGHRIASWQFIDGKRAKFPPFSACQNESLLGIEAESYLSASGFENLFEASGAKTFTYRVIRPKGFKGFFCYLENQGFLESENIEKTRAVLEGKKSDNHTLAEITVLTQDRKITWLVRSFSGKKEGFNSMQKVTAALPAIIGRMMAENSLNGKGLVFTEELGGDRRLFRVVLRHIKEQGIRLERADSLRAKA